MISVHKSVLLNETIDGLNLPVKPTVIDGTFGGGGHSLEICKRFPGARIIAIDKDKTAWERAMSKFTNLNCQINFHNADFKDLEEILNKEGVGEVDGIILDLGLSSDQLENAGRGFSFQNNEPLLMTMKDNPTEEDLTAKDIVNGWSEESLADIIYGYGEERFSRRIAKGIVEKRKIKPIETTGELVKIIEGSVPRVYRRGRLHYATRTFQALRIAVNDELRGLESGLANGYNFLKKDRRMAVISFHSLEDRIVKKFFKDKSKNKEVILINKKPIITGSQELKENPRSRSAKLRLMEKI